MSCAIERGNFPEFKSLPHAEAGGGGLSEFQIGGLSVFQVEDQRSGVGGTGAKRIMEGDWRTYWMEITGRAEPEDLSGVLPVQLGIYTEVFNRFWFEKQTGRKVTRVGEHTVHPDIPYMRCNMDGETVTAKGLRCYWDAKHVGVLNDQTILRYTPQMTHNALVIGAEWWCISFLVGNSKWDFVEQEVDPFYASDLLAKEAEFWGYVERDEEPQDGAALPPPKPVKLREVALEDSCPVWPNWGIVMAEALDDYGRVLASWTRANILRDEIKQLLPEDVGLVTRGRWRVTRNRAGAITIGQTRGASDVGA